MRLIAEGAGEEDEQADTELRAQAVRSYLDLLDKPKLSAVLLKVCPSSLPPRHTISSFLQATCSFNWHSAYQLSASNMMIMQMCCKKQIWTKVFNAKLKQIVM